MIKKCVCLLLCVSVLLSLRVGGSAAGRGKQEPASEGMDLPTYGGYTVLGDSIAAGYGLYAPVTVSGKPQNRDRSRVSGSYGDLVASALGIGEDGYHPCGHSTWRTTEFLAAINGERSWPGVMDELLEGAELDFASESRRIREALSASALVTVNFGVNDLYIYAMLETLSDFGGSLPAGEALTTDSVVTAFLGLCAAAEKNAKLEKLTRLFRQYLETGTRSFMRNVPLVIRAIRDCAGSADIVMVGTYSLLAHETEIPSALRDLMDLHAAGINSFLKNTCRSRSEYYYCDVSCAGQYSLLSTDWMEGGYVWSRTKTVCPTRSGHQYIAEAILEILRESTEKPEARVTSGLMGKNRITWSPVPSALRYRVYRSNSPQEGYRYIGVSLNQSFLDLSARRGVTYYYRVKAVMNLSGTMYTRASDPVSVRTRRPKS